MNYSSPFKNGKFVRSETKEIFFLHFNLLVVSINLSKPAAPPPPTNPRAELVYSVPWCCTLQSMKTEKQKGRQLPFPLRFHYSMT